MTEAPATVARAVRDSNDDGLVALARRESVDAIVLADPPAWSPRERVDHLAST